MRPLIRTLLLASAALSWHTVPQPDDDPPPTCLTCGVETFFGTYAGHHTEMLSASQGVPIDWQPVPNNSMIYFCKSADDPLCPQPLAKITGNDPKDWNIARGLGALYMIRGGLRNIADGRCTGASLIGGNDNVLLGDYAATPAPNTSSFINIDSRSCFWRTTGERVQCPPPEPECMPNEPGGK
jgi:hypothetical protein